MGKKATVMYGQINAQTEIVAHRQGYAPKKDFKLFSQLENTNKFSYKT